SRRARSRIRVAAAAATCSTSQATRSCGGRATSSANSWGGWRAWRIFRYAWSRCHPHSREPICSATAGCSAGVAEFDTRSTRPAEGEVAWDLYGGAGLFAAVVAARTGARTTLVESSPVGCAAARANLTDLPTVEIVEARVETALQRRRVAGPVDLVVLDPPRS